MEEIEVIRERCKASAIVGGLFAVFIVFVVATIYVNNLEKHQLKVYEATRSADEAKEKSDEAQERADKALYLYDALSGRANTSYYPGKSYTSEKRAPKEYEKYETIHKIKTLLVIAGGLIIICFGFATLGVEIVVTNKRVYGKAMFNKRVDLPLDSISSVYISGFNTVAVSSSSGRILFSFLNDAKKIHKEVCSLLLNRQNTEKSVCVNEKVTNSNADEIKKYKELFDQGIITEAEFEEKKKRLLDI